MLRKIFGPVTDGEVWQIQYNRELYELFKEKDIIVVMKIVKHRWAEHVNRMNNSEMPKHNYEL